MSAAAAPGISAADAAARLAALFMGWPLAAGTPQPAQPVSVQQQLQVRCMFTGMCVLEKKRIARKPCVCVCVCACQGIAVDAVPAAAAVAPEQRRCACLRRSGSLPVDWGRPNAFPQLRNLVRTLVRAHVRMCVCAHVRAGWHARTCIPSRTCPVCSECLPHSHPPAVLRGHSF